MNPLDLEESYKEYMDDLASHIPDGIFEVDLALLSELDLLGYEENEEEDSTLSHSFYVIESTEKLTLFNQKFVVWIVPKIIETCPMTYTLVALNEPNRVRLEMVFTTVGVYNHSSLVLRILEKFLEQIEENEKELHNFKRG